LDILSLTKKIAFYYFITSTKKFLTMSVISLKKFVTTMVVTSILMVIIAIISLHWTML